MVLTVHSFSEMLYGVISMCFVNYRRLSIHPNGNYSKGHISIFLEILDTESLPLRLTAM